MYHVSAQGVDERMINVHYYYYPTHDGTVITEGNHSLHTILVWFKRPLITR